MSRGCHGIRDIDLHDENLSGDDMTVEVVVDIFNRVNSGGTKLSKGDLAPRPTAPSGRPPERSCGPLYRDAGSQSGSRSLAGTVAPLRERHRHPRGAVRQPRAASRQRTSASGSRRQTQAIDFVLNLLSTRLGLDHDRVLMGRYGDPRDGAVSWPTPVERSRTLDSPERPALLVHPPGDVGRSAAPPKRSLPATSRHSPKVGLGIRSPELARSRGIIGGQA